MEAFLLVQSSRRGEGADEGGRVAGCPFHGARLHRWSSPRLHPHRRLAKEEHLQQRQKARKNSISLLWKVCGILNISVIS